MISRTLIALVAAGAIAASTAWIPATATPAAAQLKSGTSLDLSADKDKKKDKNKDHKKGGGQDKKGGGHKGDGKKKNGGKQSKSGGDHKGDGKKKGDDKKFKFGGDHKGDGKKKDGDKKKHDGKKFGGDKKDGKATAKRMRGLSHGHGEFAIRGRNFSTWRGDRYRARHHDRWVTFGPLSALAAILIGGERYYPYAYISAPEDYCEGFTEDGCRLRWREVETIDGDLIGQCVAYCPWQD